ncbi:MAG: DUF3500 domain-containing protein [Burkholderiales bacterium]|nr:DUF3500 domain-containing protein [Burkholderiales bacterium]
MRSLAPAFLLHALVAALPGMAMAADTAPAAAAIRAAAVRLIDATPVPQRARLLHPFALEARRDWHYTPRSRSGIPFKDMSAAQRAAGQQLLAAALSDQGLAKVRAVIALEIALRELETFGLSRDPENYAFAIFGMPDATAPWGWRIEGHHLSLHFTLADGKVVASLPQFLGANPAEVPRDIPGGPRKGARALREEDDRAFALLGALSDAQRRAAVFSEESYGDIVTGNAEKVDPLKPVGIAFKELDRGQQAQLLRIVDAFAAVVEPALAEQRLARVRAGGLDDIRFGWAGAQKPRASYYYRIQGTLFLIELDNRGGNHIHSVWRDFAGDWGRDVLGEHERRSAGTAHRH